ncbi:capping complex subunit for YIEGIA [Crassaminicella profunda]|uniref:capping complex subunit for YIEGIA n=1 Tax=Crassaminicella profunda TaxID=1286698 RepID=UPI001CA75625|nr:hypothetical protein [Crassaminicella profunda]QZY57148.1 hypothetical protein K7H06_09610 [Crassaminicella profunda]
MDFGIKDNIIAIITTDRSMISTTTVPVFYAQSEEKKERIALLVSKITMGMVHDLENGSYVVVKH